MPQAAQNCSPRLHLRLLPLTQVRAQVLNDEEALREGVQREVVEAPILPLFLREPLRSVFRPLLQVEILQLFQCVVTLPLVHRGRVEVQRFLEERILPRAFLRTDVQGDQE